MKTNLKFTVFLLKATFKRRLDQRRLIQAEVHSGTYQTSKMKRFGKIVNS